MRRVRLTLTTLLLMASLAGCATLADPNPVVNTPDAAGHVAGFILGLWHGFLFIISFVLMLFDQPYGLYDVNNNGKPYNFGYLLGAVAFTLMVIGPFYFGGRRRRSLSRGTRH